MMRLLRFMLRWLRPLTWRWAFVRWRQRLHQRPLAQWVVVHGIYIDGRDLLFGPTTGAAFSEVCARDQIFDRAVVRNELMLRVENISPKVVVFQAVISLDDLSGTGSTIVPFGPCQLEPGKIAKLSVKVMQQGAFRRLTIPTYTTRPSKVTS